MHFYQIINEQLIDNYISQLYILFKNQNWSTLTTKLKWSHYCELLLLKVTELKHEYLGQIKHYMNYVDKNIKKINQEKTIGIIICRKNNKFVMEYSSDPRIYPTTYELV